MHRETALALVAVGVAAGLSAADVVYFTDEGAFAQFNQGEGKLLKGIETFEESTAAPLSKLAFPDPLEYDVPNGPFPSGLEQDNIVIQTNVTPGPGPDAPNPSGLPQALFAAAAGFSGANSDKVGEDLEVLFGIEASLDLIFTEPRHTGIGFRLSHFPNFGGGSWHITIFDTSEVEIGSFILPTALEPNKTFFGVWSDAEIGRINIWDEGLAPDAVDDIQMWEEPCPGDFDGSGDVGFSDLTAILLHWGTACPPPCPWDLDLSGNVGFGDLTLLLLWWGPC